MLIEQQIRLGLLRGPGKQEALRRAGLELIDEDGKSYPLLGGRVPVLLPDMQQADAYARSSERMNKDYSATGMESARSPLQRLKAFLTQDYRTKSSRNAFAALFRTKDDLVLSVGGGPLRPHPQLTNLNIGPFPNVDVVADAHVLPYRDVVVDAIYCEAVLEHLKAPHAALAEMHRVLKPNGPILAITPFLQAYHGYPHHYQNFTLTGHCAALEGAGFTIVESGTCVGPMYTMVSLTSTVLAEYLPKFIGVPLRAVWWICGVFLRPLDLLIARRQNAHIVASTTYVLASKN